MYELLCHLRFRIALRFNLSRVLSSLYQIHYTSELAFYMQFFFLKLKKRYEMCSSWISTLFFMLIDIERRDYFEHIIHLNIHFLIFLFSLFSDKDECAGNAHGCQQRCVNVQGGYNCDCFNGYRLSSVDQKSCEGKVFAYMWRLSITVYIVTIHSS